MKNSPNDKIKEIINEYKDKIDLYKSFSYKVVEILEAILEENEDIKSRVHVVVPRPGGAKDIESLKEKLERLEENDKLYIENHNINSLSDVDDLSGVRAIFYLESTAEEFVQYIYREFGEKNVRLDDKEKDSGYRAIHLSIKLDDNRIQTVEYRKLKALRCEIQLTTALNHAWSGLEHEIYKNKKELKRFDPKSVKIIEREMQNIMENYIEKASQKFEVVYKILKDLNKSKKIFDLDIKEENKILKYTSNNDIYNELDFLIGYTERYVKFCRKFDIINFLEKIIEKAKRNKTKDEKTLFGIIPGKTVNDIIIQCLAILDNIKYYYFPESFIFLLKLYKHNKDESIKNEIIGIIGKLSKYNLHMLKKIGLTAQRVMLNKVMKWSKKMQVEKVEIIKIIAEEFLSPSVEGTEMKDEKTMVLRQGSLGVNDNVKRIRRETLDIIFNLYLDKNIKDINLKISLLKVVQKASQFPISSLYGEDFEKMVTDDVNYIIEQYQKIIFNKNGKLIADAAILQTIEHHLYWYTKRLRERVPGANELLKKIQENQVYSVFRLFVGDTMDFTDGNYHEVEQKRKDKINKAIKNINDNNINEWFDKLNYIADRKDIIDEWKFSAFNDALEQLAREKPKIADKILEKIFEQKNSPLKSYVGRFICGFRQGNHKSQWKKYFQKMVDEKDRWLLRSAIISFLHVHPTKIKEQITKDDISILENIINKKKPFNYLDKIDEEDERADLNLHWSIMQVLVHIFNKDKKQIEKLIIQEIKNNNKSEYLYTYIQSFSMGEFRGIFKINDLSKEAIKVILDAIVELSSLDHDSERVLEILTKKYFKEVLDVFIRRIEKDINQDKTNKDLFEINKYDSIPYHFSEKLGKIIKEKNEHLDIIQEWLQRYKPTDTIIYWRLGEFISRIGSTEKIILLLIKSGKKGDLKRAVKLFGLSSHVDFNLCLKIVEQTDDKKIWGAIESAMHKTGVVSGEDGLVRAYTEKLKRLEKLEKEYKKLNNKRVLKFIKEASEGFRSSIKNEKKRMEEEMALRKMEFES